MNTMMMIMMTLFITIICLNTIHWYYLVQSILQKKKHNLFVIFRLS